MFSTIVNKLKKNLPRPIYNLIKLPYSLVFTNPKYAFGPIGFLQKTKLDIYELFGKENYLIHYGNLKFYDEGWKMLLEKNGYYRLNHLNNILDLGGFVGDSPIELTRHNNKKIFVFEPEKEKYRWLLKNIKLNKLEKSIMPYNSAVTAEGIKEMSIKKEGDFCGGSSFHDTSEFSDVETVSCVNIKDVMKLEDFDGFKCDIEGGEFQIIEYFLKNQKEFTFKKGAMEWHFFDKNEKNKNILLRFLKFLKDNDYNFFFYPQNKPKQILETKKELNKIFNDPNGAYPYTNMFYFYKK
jgi:FkbM family methyltransferase